MKLLLDPYFIYKVGWIMPKNQFILATVPTLFFTLPTGAIVKLFNINQSSINSYSNIDFCVKIMYILKQAFQRLAKSLLTYCMFNKKG